MFNKFIFILCAFVFICGPYAYANPKDLFTEKFFDAAKIEENFETLWEMLKGKSHVDHILSPDRAHQLYAPLSSQDLVDNYGDFPAMARASKEFQNLMEKKLKQLKFPQDEVVINNLFSINPQLVSFKGNESLRLLKGIKDRAAKESAYGFRNAYKQIAFANLVEQFGRGKFYEGFLADLNDGEKRHGPVSWEVLDLLAKANESFPGFTDSVAENRSFWQAIDPPKCALGKVFLTNMIVRYPTNSNIVGFVKKDMTDGIGITINGITRHIRSQLDLGREVDLEISDKVLRDGVLNAMAIPENYSAINEGLAFLKAMIVDNKRYDFLARDNKLAELLKAWTKGKQSKTKSAQLASYLAFSGPRHNELQLVISTLLSQAKAGQKLLDAVADGIKGGVSICLEAFVDAVQNGDNRRELLSNRKIWAAIGKNVSSADLQKLAEKMHDIPELWETSAFHKLELTTDTSAKILAQNPGHEQALIGLARQLDNEDSGSRWYAAQALQGLLEKHPENESLWAMAAEVSDIEYGLRIDILRSSPDNPVASRFRALLEERGITLLAPSASSLSTKNRSGAKCEKLIQGFASEDTRGKP